MPQIRRHGLCSLDALCVFALHRDRAPIDAINARLDRPAVGKRKVFLRAARPDLLNQKRQGRALGLQVYLVDCRCDQSFALGVQHKGIFAPAHRLRLY